MSGWNRIDKLRRGNLTEEIRERVKDYIVANDLSVGDRLPSEQELADVMGVGRNTTREALKSLQEVGIVEVRVGDGVFVGEPSYERLAKHFAFILARNMSYFQTLVEARFAFELAVMVAAIDKVKEQDLRELEQINAKCETAQCTSEMQEADMLFHLKLVEITDNSFFKEMCSPVTGFFCYLSKLKVDDHETFSSAAAVASHRQIIQALASRDLNMATRIIREDRDNYFDPQSPWQSRKLRNDNWTVPHLTDTRLVV